jgi:hypothetical protein
MATMRDPKVKAPRQTSYRAQVPRTRRRRRATQPDFHARATSPQGLPRLATNRIRQLRAPVRPVRIIARTLAAAVIAVLPLACVSGCIAPSNPFSGGVAGTLQTRPTATCMTPAGCVGPVQARLSFIAPNGDIWRTSSGVARGRFYMQLAPGSYVLKVVGPNGCYIMRKVKVRSDKVIHLRLLCQSVG